MGFVVSSIAVFVVLIILVYILLRVFLLNGVPCKSKERLDGKTAIITGGNTGIGKATAADLASRGARVILACRNLAKGSRAAEEIKQTTGNDEIVVKKLDLASCKSVREFAAEILREEPHINILINNAGVIVPYEVTEEGFELTFGVNHLAHFLLTNLLLERIEESAPSRIIVVAALAHVFGNLDFEDMMWKNGYNRFQAYSRSKLANVMFARELAKRVAGTGITVCSLHPGIVNTEIARYFMTGWLALLKPVSYIARLFLMTPMQGAQTSIHCAVAREVEGISGKYWDSCAITEPSENAKNDEDCQRLWEYSAKLVGLEE